MTLPRRTVHTDLDTYVQVVWESRASASQAERDHVNEAVFRRLEHGIEDLGYTTHLDVVRHIHDHQTDPTGGDFIHHRYEFPPRRPSIGQPARIDGGYAHNARFHIDHPGQDEAKVSVSIVGTEREVRVYRYGFDTATGEWIFTESQWMQR